MTAPYLERLARRSAAAGTVLCLGLDPDPGRLPGGFPRDVRGVEAFAALVLDACAAHAAAVKPNLAFYEAFGSAGIAALERIRGRVPAGLPVILDGKRGDIGTTSARQAAALFDALGADAVTVNPYLGEAAIEPLLERVDRFAYVLCRTSNPGAEELQALEVAAGGGAPREPLYARVARRAARWGPGGTVGLVVGATAPAELAELRALAPGFAFLVPGVGAQGGDLAAVMSSGRATSPPAGGGPGGGLLVNVSRGIATVATEGVSSPPKDGATGPARGASATSLDLAERLEAAARDWAERLPVLP